MTAPRRVSARTLLRMPAGWVATGAGVGFAPVASGTFGTLAALLPWLALRELPLAWYVLAVTVAFVLGVWAANRVIATIEVQDPSVVVWDEFVGVWITLAAAPRGWPWILAGFALFRLFDIWKPWPVRWADEHVHGGLGAMLDDALAGVLGLVALQGLAFAFGAGAFAG
jgi:phosphatidylglycerophosphatase A